MLILSHFKTFIFNSYELLSAAVTNHSAAVNSTDTGLVLLRQ